MTLCKVVHDKNNPYLTINTTIANDFTLSWKAKGIWFYAFSKKDDWKFYFKDLQKRSTDGRDSLRAGIKELEKAGYLSRKAARSDNGQMCGQEWTFYETPREVEVFNEDSPEDGKPVLREPRESEDRPLVTNDSKQVMKEEQLLEPAKGVLGKEASSKPVVVFPPLKSISGLRADRAAELTSIFTEEQLGNAIEMILISTAHIPNPFGWLKDCIEKGWETNLPDEQCIKKNKRIMADRFHRLDGMTIAGEQITKLNKYIEFLRGGVGNCTTIIRFDDPQFEHKMESKIAELNERKRRG